MFLPALGMGASRKESAGEQGSVSSAGRYGGRLPSFYRPQGNSNGFRLSIGISRLPNIRMVFLPAGGNRNGQSLNNPANGYYWSSSLNTSNPINGRNLNFNSGSANMNNNNRYNGFSVRAVFEHLPSSLLSGYGAAAQ